MQALALQMGAGGAIDASGALSPMPVAQAFAFNATGAAPTSAFNAGATAYVPDHHQATGAMGWVCGGEAPGAHAHTANVGAGTVGAGAVGANGAVEGTAEQQQQQQYAAQPMPPLASVPWAPQYGTAASIWAPAWQTGTGF